MRSLEELSLSDWQAFAEVHPEVTTFHHRHWIELLIDTYRLPLHIPALVDDGEILAAAPFLETPTLGWGKKLISLPYSDSVRPLARTLPGLEAFFGELSAADWSRYRSVVIRTDGPTPTAPRIEDWVRHEISIEGGFEAYASTLPSALRRSLRKANRSELRFERCQDWEAVEHFYRLHVLTRRRLGVPVQTKRFFRFVHSKIMKSGLGFVGLVKMGNSPIAAAVFLSFGKTLVYKFGASDPEFLGHRPNEVLFSSALRIAFEEGYQSFDFGVSRITDDGLRRFKGKWRSVESPVYHSFIRGDATPSQGDGRLLRLTGKVIQRSPTLLCRGLGAALYRYAT